MDKKALIYLLRLTIQKVLGLLLYLIGAGLLISKRAMIYFSFYIVGSIISGVIIYRANSKTLAERNKIKTNSPIWDKVLLGTFWLLQFFVIYLLAGFEANKLSENVGIIYWIGIIINLLSGSLALWAMLVNTFLESTARIQDDRKQTVCQNGPYGIVRHPMYLSVLLSNIGICMVFPSLGVIICAIAIVVIIIIRTYMEDKMLQDGLNGYKEYTKKVKHRLIPFVW